MKLVHPSIKIDSKIRPKEIMKDIERYGRVSHKSEDNITKDSHIEFIRKLINWGHESVLEHKSISVRIIGDRGLTHELVRHRLAAYTQESTRYCDYSNDHITFIIPTWAENIEPGVHDWYNKYKGSVNDNERIWLNHMFITEVIYKTLTLELEPQFSRGVLPINVKTEVVSTFNLRMWRHVFRERIGEHVHPQINNVMVKILKLFYNELPVIFEDIIEEREISIDE